MIIMRKLPIVKTIYRSVLSFILIICLMACSQKVNNERILSEASKINHYYLDSIINSDRDLGLVEPAKDKKVRMIRIAKALKNNDYNQVIEFTNDYNIQYSKNPEVQYMLASAFFQKREYSIAAQHFINLFSQKNFNNKEMVKYYLAICYLKFGAKEDIKNALNLLKQLQSDTDNKFNRKEIQSLLDLYD